MQKETRNGELACRLCFDKAGGGKSVNSGEQS